MSKIIKEENLVTLGGWTRDRRSYKKFIDAAPIHWKVYVPSYRELKPYKGIDFFQENLLKYLKKHSLSKINLLGHSLGAALAIYFAANYPQKLKKLFLVDSKGLYKSESIFNSIYSLYKEHTKRSTSENIRDFFRFLGNPFLNFRLGLLAHYADIEKEAKQVKTDTLIFWGEQDLIAPLSKGKKLQNLIPNSKLFILKGMGHDWIFDNHEHFWEKVEGQKYQSAI